MRIMLFASALLIALAIFLGPSAQGFSSDVIRQPGAPAHCKANLFWKTGQKVFYGGEWSFGSKNKYARIIVADDRTSGNWEHLKGGRIVCARAVTTRNTFLYGRGGASIVSASHVKSIAVRAVHK